MTLANTPLENAPLGQRSDTPTHYDPRLLFPIPRHMARDGLQLGASLPFMGADFWTGYELGWLNRKGKPQVGILHVTVPCETPFIVESKSFKLYLNSFNNHRVDSADAIAQLIDADINPVLWGGAAPQARAIVKIITPEQFENQRFGTLQGFNLDRLDIDVEAPHNDPTQLRVIENEGVVEETLHSNLLRALCRVTGQPDWGSVQIDYIGKPIDQACLLRYLIGFRDQQEFHEPLAERIFVDVLRQCQPSKLRVKIQFTRRGGMDINPVRQNFPGAMMAMPRLARQ